ncbi:DUF6163 family protein [Allorhizobium undicola]|uniref:DUF6163 family protein n=1 Tax=Allorhizobium undicola TaxID=78527 RepID=UPI000486E800|nr:DUF6163 family protein [Allorhizobium undicola]
MQDESVHTPKPSLTDLLFVLFLRIVAFCGLWVGLKYWAMLVGFPGQGAMRFDLMPIPWRVAATSLAVVFPVAAIGLWMTVSWGVVIWIIGAGAQIAMHGVWPRIFGPDMPVILFHLAVAGAYLAFRIMLYIEWRRKEEVRLDLP